MKRIFLFLLSLGITTYFTGTLSAQNNVPMPKVPEGFEATIFAQPPEVNYPACLCAAPTGEVFVGVDRQGSLGRKPGQGMVLRCIDSNGDGVADKINTFAKMDHPRGLVFDNGQLWVLHPPFLSLYHDTDGDGIADKSEILVTGLTTDYIKRRGADHTTNGIRMGIDGWIYIAVGDFGMVNAKGKDGRTLTLKGGGIVRVRPDGTEMELFSRGQRNIMDVAIDPQLNIFTRDNTNDGGGWDIRLSHILQSANYGYPSLFKNFNEEIMPALADYGGGSGCGSMFLSEPFLPKPYNNALLTCDWGRSQVYYHPLKKDGPTYQAKQEEFVSLPRPTDIDVDGRGQIYISSWHNGKFNYSGVNVGYVALVKPKNLQAPAFPNLSKLSDEELLKELLSASQVRRFHVQKEILRRGQKAMFESGLTRLMTNANESVDARVAALFTFKQLYGTQAHPSLVKLAEDDVMREFALRALTDRKTQLEGVPLELFTRSLADDNPRVKVAALIGLGRLGQKEAAGRILPLAVPPQDAKLPTQPIYRSSRIKGKKVAKVEVDITGAKKLFLVVTEGGDGNGLDHAVWGEPMLSGPKGDKKLTELKWTSAKAGWGGVHINRDCQNRAIRFQGKPVEFGIGTHAYSVIAYDLAAGYTKFSAKGFLDDGSNKGGRVEFVVYRDHLPASVQSGGTKITSDPKRVIPHIAVQSMVQLHAVDACLEGIESPYRDGALWALRYMHDEKAVKGLITKLRQTRNVELRQQILTTLIRLYHKECEYKGTWWGTRPDNSGPYYHRTTWDQSPRIENVLRKELLAAHPDTVNVMLAELQRHHVELKNLSPDLVAKAKEREKPAPTIAVSIPKFDPNNPNQIGNIPFEKLLPLVTEEKGNVEMGAQLFEKQSCVACHAIKPGQRPIGPQLIDIGKRYNRKQLAESVIKPSATLAQGFETNLFELKSGQVLQGFVIREAAEELEVRTSEGKSFLLKTDDIMQRIPSKQSAMPEGLVNNLTVREMASLLDFLESLKSE